MAIITASMVKELRERTDAPMMDCKKALTEAEGDMSRGEEILRVRFGNKASKAAGRVAAEGIVGISLTADSKTGTLLEVNSETDFCAKNEAFIAYVDALASVINEHNPADMAAAATLPMDGATVEETRAQLA
ncbi:MAG: translation elongation factor Ts, partial [Betaproteobacteria bacterium]|nr:translation elongation factor Ts [Betaproteobacteria bacterium]